VTKEVPELRINRYLSCLATSGRRHCHSPKAPAARQPQYTATARRSSPSCRAEPESNGNGRPTQPRDLVKRSGRLWVVPFLKQKYWQAKLAGVKVGRSLASPTNTSACTPPPRGRAPYQSESCWYGNWFFPSERASCQLAASTLKRGPHVKKKPA
jgi:hypothetical protein